MLFKWLDSLLLILNVVFVQDTYKWHSYCILFRFIKATLRPSLTDCKTLLVKTMCPYLIGYMGIQFLQTWKYLSYSVSFIACEVLCSLLHRKVLKSKTAVKSENYNNAYNVFSDNIFTVVKVDWISSVLQSFSDYNKEQDKKSEAMTGIVNSWLVLYKPLAGKSRDSREEPTAMIFLNGHSTKLFLKLEISLYL